MTGLIILLTVAIVLWLAVLLAWAAMLREVLWSLYAIWMVLWLSKTLTSRGEPEFWVNLGVLVASTLAPVIGGLIHDRRERMRIARRGLIWKP